MTRSLSDYEQKLFAVDPERERQIALQTKRMNAGRKRHIAAQAKREQSNWRALAICIFGRGQSSKRRTRG